MALTKNPITTYHAPVAARPEVPFRASYTVCGQTPAQGHWVTEQSSVIVRADPGKVIPWPPGTVSVTVVGDDNDTPLDPTDDTAYFIFTVNTTKWVQTSPPGPVVCTTYPEQPFVPAVPYQPAYTEYQQDLGWTAGANSIDELDGNVRVSLDMPTVVGVVVGLTQDRIGVADRSRINYGLYFHQSAGGAPLWNIIEGGVLRTSNATYAPADLWEITRADGTVRYYRNGLRVYTSTVASSGPISVGSVMYATGDSIP